MAGARFSPEQLNIARGLLSAPQYRGAGPKVKQAEAETGIVESGLSNPSMNSEGSAGPLQQTPKDGWGSEAQVRNSRYASEQFLKRAIPLAGKYGTAGELAQAVQRSAYPKRYDEHAAEAAQLLQLLGGNPAPHQALTRMGAGAAPAPVQAEAVQPVGPSSAQTADLTQLLQSLTQPHTSSSLAETPLTRPTTSGGPEVAAGSPRVPSPLASAAAPAPNLDAQLALVQKIGEDATPEAPAAEAAPANGISPAAPQTNRGISQGGLTAPKGLVNFGGKQVAAWIAPALKYAQEKGWKGSVSSGYRSKAEQERIYNSGVRPAAVPGTSNHEGDVFPRGAVDVTEAQQLSRILQGSPYAKLLVYAGSKDPVHFSHPHNGSY